MRILLFFLLLSNKLFAQNLNQAKLKIENDGNWIEYAIPEFMNNISQADNMSPHYVQYDFESSDKGAIIFIIINNSSVYRFNLKSSYAGELSRKDVKVTYKLLKEDKYFISGTLNNGHTLYEFCKVKNGYGYTYSIEYDKSYADYFNRYIPEIIKCFRVF